MQGNELLSAEVLIAGGGPVGFGLAIDLALRGVSVLIIERHQTIQRIPKGQNLTQRTGEHFRRWGVTEAIREATPIPREFGNAGMTAYGSLLSGYHHDWFNRASVAPYYATTNERLPQYETEKVLRQRAAELPNIKVMTGWTFVAQQSNDETVSIEIEQTQGSERQTLTGRYLVGTDGANSAVRRAAGITQTTTEGHRQRMALLVFHSTELDQLLEAFKGKTIYNALGKEMQGYWQFLGRVDLNGNWFFHAPVPDDTSVEQFDFKGLVYRAVGAEFPIEFEYKGLWDLRLTVADTYHQERLFIAGDAAHSHPPYGGYGVNTGFEDARNLSWKLAAALQGWAGPNLLSSYTDERKPVFESTRDDFILRMINEDAKAVNNYDPDTDIDAFLAYWEERASGEDVDVTQYLPQISGSPLVLNAPHGQTSARGVHTHKAQPGYHLSPRALADGTPIYDRIGGELQGANFSLIAIDQPAELVSEFKRQAAKLGMPLVVIESELGGTAMDWEAKLILVRPDEYIAYVADALYETAPSSQLDTPTTDSTSRQIEDILKTALGYSA